MPTMRSSAAIHGRVFDRLRDCVNVSAATSRCYFTGGVTSKPRQLREGLKVSQAARLIAVNIIMGNARSPHLNPIAVGKSASRYPKLLRQNQLAHKYMRMPISRRRHARLRQHQINAPPPTIAIASSTQNIIVPRRIQSAGPPIQKLCPGA